MREVDISAVIVNWNTRELLLKCLRSLSIVSTELNTEVIVVDNGSSDGSSEAVAAEFPHVIVIRNGRNLGFAAANNIGIRAARGRYIALINSDVVVLPECLEKLCAYMDAHHEVGIIAPKILWPDRRLQDSCRRFPSVWNNFCQDVRLRRAFPNSAFFAGEHMMYFAHDRIADVDYLVGCFLMARREMIEQVGPMDERFFIYAEEVDWCKRAKTLGWKILFFPSAEALHYGRSSSSREASRFALEQQRSILQYWQKHHSLAGVGCIRMIKTVQWSRRLLWYAWIYTAHRSNRSVTGPIVSMCWRGLCMAAIPGTIVKGGGH